ncbi:response regulator transcription factor [Pedobacter frigidisoli]|uniref:Response regulator transcription factor n=1 Tax=Pedobacter frigidisoli TaxID=2530455 RepID=A0A4R0P1W4_9SPHI|nr:LytTR family DNA-binding domain-containing protein [Pedobacter frigidisoli]TCD07140.1 response regulator transcription factor [Pedobacter frigidisoli]
MNAPLSCIVVDDSDLDRKAVECEIHNSLVLKLDGSFDNCIEALSFYNHRKPDILFVDIDMPEINGLEFIKAINSTNTINVIISSHPEYALEGFQLKVFDFILKPLETDRFESTINRLLDFIQLKSKAEAYDVLFDNEHVVFKDGLKTIKLDVNEILYLEAFGDYTKIVTDKKVHLTLTTLSRFVDSLPLGKFIRIHRSYVIAKNKVNSFGSKSVNVDANILPIGKTYLREAKQILNFS